MSLAALGRNGSRSATPESGWYRVAMSRHFRPRLESLEERTLLVGGPILFDNFAGIPQLDGQPPDPIAAVGPYNLLGAVNDDVALFNKETGQQIDLVDFRDFFGTVQHGYQIFDPWVVYDTYSQRYVVLAGEVENGAGADEAYFLIGISTTDNPDDFDTRIGDPDNDWHVYSVAAGHDFGNGATWADYPKLAVDADTIYITSNNLTFGSLFGGLLVTRINKIPMLNGTLGSVTQLNGTAAGLLKTTQPAQSTGSLAAQPQLFVSPCLPTNDLWPGIRVFELSDSNVFSGGSACLGSPFRTGHFATQAGSHAQFISAGSQLMNGVWRNNALWTAHAVSDVSEPSRSVTAGGLPISIPDLGTATPALAVTGLDGLLVDVDVHLTINHSYDSDLDVYLISPQGTRVELFTDVGGSEDNFTDTILDDVAHFEGTPRPIASGTAPFTGRYRPEGFLSVLEGEDPNGQWLLELSDDAAGDIGTLVNWSLDLKVGDNTVRWYQIDTTGGNYSLIQQGDIDPGPGSNTFFPAITVDGGGNMGITYTESSYRQFPQMMIAGRRASDPPGYTSPGVVVKSSSFAYGQATQVDGVRWGDYGGIAVDPADDLTFWAFNEYAASTSTWGTWWGAFTFATASLSGEKWQDTDGDGNRGTSEPIGVGSIFLDGNNNGVIDAESHNATATVVPTRIFDTKSLASRIDITGLSGLLLDVNVSVTIDHSYDGDLDVLLFSPSGTQVELFTDVGGSGDNFTGTILDDEATSPIASGSAPFSGIFRPEGSLHAVDWENPNGSWTLLVTDDAGGDVGVLQSWSLQIEYGDPNLLTLNGDYGFPDLAPGTYYVRELHQPGTLQTWPRGAHSVSLSAGENVPGLDFGNARPVGIYGRKWNDMDGDGFEDGSEAGLAGRTVYVDANQNGVWDSGTTRSPTNALAVPIVDLRTTSSTIPVVHAAGRVLDVNVRIQITHSYDADLDVVLVSPSGTEVKLFSDVGGFGDNFLDTILDDEAAVSIFSGTAPFTGSYRPEDPLSAFDGEDPNGVWQLQVTDDQGGDAGTLSLWQLYVTYGDPSDQTDSSGNYQIPSLAPGHYLLREQDQAGWVRTYPDERFLYAAIGATEGIGRIAAIDPRSGGSLVLGTTGTEGMVGLATDPLGNLVGVGLGGGSSSKAYHVSPLDGSTTLLANLGLTSFPEGGLAIAPDGAGYAVRTLLGQPPELYRIDFGASAVTFLGPLSLPVTAQVDGLEFRRGELFALVTELGGGLTNHLVKINLSTLAIQDVGPLGTNIGLLAGLAYDAREDFFYATGNGNRNLFRIEPSSAMATLVGPTGLDDVSGLAMSSARGTQLAGAHVLFAESGANWFNVSFGNMQTAEVRGIKYQDTNGNARLDAGEPPLANRVIYLDSNQNGILDNIAREIESPSRNKAIVDLATTTSTLSLSQVGGSIDDLNVILNIDHTYDGDLEVTLISPTGTRVRLFNRIGGAGDDFIETRLDDEALVPISSGTPPYIGSFRPLESLSLFDGQDPNGTWTLEIVDHAASDVGTLLSWRLEVASSEPHQATDLNGQYVFAGLRPGRQDVREIVPPGWLATQPISAIALRDDFEDNNLLEYTRAEFATFAGFTNAAAAHDGNWGMVAGDWMYRADSLATVQQGDVVSAWIRFANNANGRAQLGFGASAAGTLSLVLAPETHELLIENNLGFGFSPIGRVHQNYSPDRWYRAEVTWGVGGMVVGRLYDSDGSTLLGSVTAIDNSVSSGGIAIRGSGAGSVRQVDTITIYRNGAHSVALSANQVANGVNFGNAQPGSVSGIKWHDVDGDRTRDGNEPVLPGWTVYLDADRNGVINQQTRSLTSVDIARQLPDISTTVATLPVITLSGLILDVNATLDISHSSVGDLEVYLIGPQGRRVELFSQVGGFGDNFANTTLDDEAAQPITSGTPPFSGTFRPEGQLSDFDGLDPNGIWRLEIVDRVPLDQGILNSWSLTLTTGDPSTVTTSLGSYSFGNLGPSTYRLREAMQPGWIQTTPTAGYHDAAIASGQTLTERDFGNRLPWLSINDISMSEGNSGSQSFSFTVTLLDASPLTVTSQFQTADGTAHVSDGDYLAASGSVTFAPGQPLTQTIQVSVLGDTRVEPTETFLVNLLNATNATILRTPGVGTIQNDDATTLPGDFNGDQSLDCTDVNALVVIIAAGSHVPEFDLTNDGLVTSMDLDRWLVLAGAMPGSPTGGRPFLKGDANLDGVVDGSDFGIWNSHKFTVIAAWCAGDFNADGVVDGSDFGIWNSNKFRAAEDANADTYMSLERTRVRAGESAAQFNLETESVQRANASHTAEEAPLPQGVGIAAAWRSVTRDRTRGSKTILFELDHLFAGEAWK
jgi:subtilisin-like proprotein convertase family protein